MGVGPDRKSTDGPEVTTKPALTPPAHEGVEPGEGVGFHGVVKLVDGSSELGQVAATVGAPLVQHQRIPHAHRESELALESLRLDVLGQVAGDWDGEVEEGLGDFSS
jgi:hypothetical protein